MSQWVLRKHLLLLPLLGPLFTTKDNYSCDGQTSHCMRTNVKSTNERIHLELRGQAYDLAGGTYIDAGGPLSVHPNSSVSYV